MSFIFYVGLLFCYFGVINKYGNKNNNYYQRSNHSYEIGGQEEGLERSVPSPPGFKQKFINIFFISARTVNVYWDTV